MATDQHHAYEGKQEEDQEQVIIHIMSLQHLDEIDCATIFQQGLIAGRFFILRDPLIFPLASPPWPLSGCNA